MLINIGLIVTLSEVQSKSLKQSMLLKALQSYKQIFRILLHKVALPSRQSILLSTTLRFALQDSTVVKAKNFKNRNGGVSHYPSTAPFANTLINLKQLAPL